MQNITNILLVVLIAFMAAITFKLDKATDVFQLMADDTNQDFSELRSTIINSK